MDPNDQSFGESEQELGDEDISEELNNSDLSKSIQPSVPGSLFQDKMKAQADRAQETMNKIKQARELVDSASTQEVLRDCNLEGIRDEVLELEAQAADINCDLYQQRGAKTSVVEMR